ncbi:MAG: 2-isopropylmalate synthase, partial [Lachnospiraceae bacterium]|nr:2-isopropylmalate synthase [Lachnospiraceae bacterium]
MKNFEHYKRGYYMPPVASTNWVNKEYVDKAPAWCSVDLRDGNQALIVPMSLEEKIEFFKELVRVGFKEIEIGFPAASETEYEFCRVLIEQNLIPDDVTIQVLTQAREHIIKKTFDAVQGAKNAVVHLYNSTSYAQRTQVFKKSKEEILKIATDGAKLLNDMAAEHGVNYQFEYSPESFTGTEIDYALEVCNAVIDIWQPTPDRKVIINLPATVEMSLPHVYASQIEYMSNNMHCRENVILSLHPHNDRGCGVADAELGLLAGADRIEGTLFGNGERTGNVDIITLAMNMFTHGVDPELDLTDIPRITEIYERLTRMHVYERSPYTGKLVFAAFSGSHQDAIAKGMKCREDDPNGMWTVPYLPLNPEDIGRQYDGDVIRINSQSGKGGIGYILEQKYGFDLPAKMREDLGYTVKGVSDHQHKELSAEEVHEIFINEYVNKEEPIKLLECHFKQIDGIEAEITILVDGAKKVYHGHGNGRLDAVSNAIMKHFDIKFALVTYEEHALQVGSNSQACAYVGIEVEGMDKATWGAG